MTKTFKSEYFLGAKCIVEIFYWKKVGESVVKISYGTGDSRIFRLWEKEKMYWYLMDNTSSYWADQVMEYINVKTKIS